MNNSFKNKRLVEIIAALLILLFVYTGASKFMEIRHFRLVLSQSPLIGTRARLLSWSLPLIELNAAALLFFPITRKGGFIVSIFLLVLFTIYISYMILFSPELPCSCGGVIKRLTWTQHLWLNIVFTMIAAFGLWLDRSTKSFIAINRKSRIPV